MTDPELTASDATGELVPQEICEEVLLEKYAKGNEQTISEVRMRMALLLPLMEVRSRDSLYDWIGEYYLYGARYLPKGEFRMFRAIAPIVLLRLTLLFGYVGRLSSRRHCVGNSLEPLTLLNFLRPCVRAPPSLFFD